MQQNNNKKKTINGFISASANGTSGLKCFSWSWMVGWPHFKHPILHYHCDEVK